MRISDWSSDVCSSDLKYETTPFLASKIVFNGFSKKDQALIQEAAIEAGKFNREESLKSDAKLRQVFLDAGLEINEIDSAPFIEKTKSVYDKWRKDYPEMVDLVVSEARS